MLNLEYYIWKNFQNYTVNQTNMVERTAYRILLKKPHDKRPLGKLSKRWVDKTGSKSCPIASLGHLRCST